MAPAPFPFHDSFREGCEILSHSDGRIFTAEGGPCSYPRDEVLKDRPFVCRGSVPPGGHVPQSAAHFISTASVFGGWGLSSISLGSAGEAGTASVYIGREF